MDIEIVAIGDEILRGMRANTNAVFLSHGLFEKGYPIARQTVLSDEPAVLQRGLAEALNRSDIVITTGGLGPTCDDRTREIAAELFSSPFHYDPEVAADLKRRFGDQLKSLKDQATIPKKATPLLNPVGTAPGFIFHEGGKTLILLPGVPPEMKELFSQQVLPYLLSRFPPATRSIYREIHFCLLNENLVDPLLRELKVQFPEVAFGIYPGHGTLVVSIQAEQQEVIKACEHTFQREFGSYIFQSPQGKIEEAVHEWFTREKKTLALAESCTGGMIAMHLTAQSGASDYFLGSLVTYTNSWKEKFLHVSSRTLEEKGAVSREVVEEMVRGVFSETAADYAIAVSGIAGPSGGTPEKPVGTVWIGMGKRGEAPEVATFMAPGNRSNRILWATNAALGSLYRKVVHGIGFF